MFKMKVQKLSLIEKISNILMLKSKFITDLGFLDGKMGIAISFANLSRHLSNDVYYDYMGDLIDEIMDNIHKGLDISFMSGLSGIGWGIEYLIQNNYVVGSGVDICEEIDKRIMDIDPRRISDISLDTGFEGLLHYIIYHLQGAIKQKNILPFDEVYLTDIYSVCNKISTINDIDSMLKKMIESYKLFYINRLIIKDYEANLLEFITLDLVFKEDKLSNYSLGMRNGLGGALLQTIKRSVL